MRVLAALQATKQPTLLGRFAPGEVGVREEKAQLDHGLEEPGPGLAS